MVSALVANMAMISTAVSLPVRQYHSGIERITPEFVKKWWESHPKPNEQISTGSTGKLPDVGWALTVLGEMHASVSFDRIKPGGDIMPWVRFWEPPKTKIYPAVVRLRLQSTKKVIWWTSIPDNEVRTEIQALRAKARRGKGSSVQFSSQNFSILPSEKVALELVYRGHTYLGPAFNIP